MRSAVICIDNGSADQIRARALKHATFYGISWHLNHQTGELVDRPATVRIRPLQFVKSLQVPIETVIEPPRELGPGKPVFRQNPLSRPKQLSKSHLLVCAGVSKRFEYPLRAFEHSVLLP